MYRVAGFPQFPCLEPQKSDRLNEIQWPLLTPIGGPFYVGGCGLAQIPLEANNRSIWIFGRVLKVMDFWGFVGPVFEGTLFSFV